MGPSVKFVLAIIDSISKKKWVYIFLLVPKASEASLGTFYFCRNYKWVGERVVTVMGEWARGYCGHTSSMYLVWEMTSQFGGLWWHILEVIGYCCFWWCFYRWVWLDHHISSLYLVWEMTCQFWGPWWHFLEVMGYCCFWWYFYKWVWSDHHISSLYLVWEMTSQFWGLWWHFLEVMSYCCFWW